jgi:uncharacterized protein YqgC (DUF456 family)
MKIFIAILTALFILIGIVGIVIPGLPASPLILIGAVIYGFGFGFGDIGLTTYIILCVLTVLSLIIEYIGSMIGAKGFGATKFGIIGAVLGLIIGFIVGNIWGLILGPFVGAFVGELIRTKHLRESAKAGLGATLGLMGGVMLRFPICVVMIALIAWRIFW